MVLEILKYPDKRLRNQCEQVTKFDSEFQSEIEQMFETMYAAPGIGLAAIQVGIFKRFFIMDVGINEGEVIKRNPMVIVNPVILSKEGEIVWEEGCLSCPDLIVPMTRAQKVELEYQDRNGKKEKLTAEDLMAVCIQHEIDHLDGVLIVDQISRLKQDLYKKKLKSSNQPVVR